jgi:ABC-type uncharacterized transport system permease subunit
MCQNEQLLPEKVMRYISSRVKYFHVAMDALCTSGSGVINFALEGCMAIGLSPNARNLTLARANAKIYKVSNLVEFV